MRAPDINDTLCAQGPDAVRDRHDAAVKFEPRAEPEKDRLRPLDIHTLFARHIPEREMILDPVIPQKGLAMLYSARGIGKTHVAVGISCAAATGTRFLKWSAPTPRRVLHVDGEMAAVDLRERFRHVLHGSVVKPASGFLSVLSADLIDLGIGNLASAKVQQELDPWLAGVELLVLDNLSSLTAVIRDNDAESWNEDGDARRHAGLGHAGNRRREPRPRRRAAPGRNVGSRDRRRNRYSEINCSSHQEAD